MDQIKHFFRPGGEADDHIMYGTPLKDAQDQEKDTAQSTAHPTAGTASQQPSGETGREHPGTTLSQLKEQGGGSTMSVKSGVLGPYASNTDDSMAGHEPGTASSRAAGSADGKAEQNFPGRVGQRYVEDRCFEETVLMY